MIRNRLMPSASAGCGAAIAFFTTMAFSTVPTPLYVLYAERHALSPLTITYIFAVYALGVIAGLIAVGHVSDWARRSTSRTPRAAQPAVRSPAS
ncbi:hypothetical protein [Streptomyces sp. NPDC058240]|uniref:hypothetical protein n=1 Tax=Streptomyces sp. NPDC058240 TaxID=3346396 RepID=UPI0036EAD6EB